MLQLLFLSSECGLPLAESEMSVLGAWGEGREPLRMCEQCCPPAWGEAAVVCGSLQVSRSERACLFAGVFEREREKGGETVSGEYVTKANIILILKKLKLFV